MTDRHGNKKSFGSSTTLGLCLFLIIGAFFLWTEHRAHLFGNLPYLILLACPLIYMFMHRGHGGPGHADDPHESTRTRRHGEAS